MNGDNTCFLFSRFFHHSCNYRSKNGYRLIDTARYYDNEEAVGKGIKRAIEPGCRNNWHIHHAKKGGGQVLIATAGSGWYQIEGQAPVSLNPGDAVVIPANVKHWHGAKKNSWFSHIAFEAPGEGTSNEWLEPVAGEDYDKLK